MVSTPLSTDRKAWLIGVCGAALLALAACDGPPRPEPAAPPPSPEQDYAEQDEAEYGDAEEVAPEDDELDEQAKPPAEDDFAADEPPEVVTMDPIPNPEGEDAYGRRLDPRRAPPREPERQPEPDVYDQPDDRVDEDFARRDGEEKPPAGADERHAQDEALGDADPDARSGTMAPIPNPPIRHARGRPDDGLMGGPGPSAAPAPPAMTRAEPPRRAAPAASGPRVRVPIRRPTPSAMTPARPAAQSRPAAPGASPPTARGERPALRGPQPAPAVRPAAPERSPAQRLETAASELRSDVERNATLDAPSSWTAGETREVRLRLPAGFGERMERAVAGLNGAGTPPSGAGELSVTLRGEGFRIEPSGPQSISAAAADQPLAWRVTPERADAGALTATVDAVMPVGTEQRTVSLGEVSNEASGGLGGLSMRTLGWILLVVLGGALLAWLAGRSGGGGEAAASRRRRRVRAAQRRDSIGPMDLSPGERGGVPEPR